MHLAFDIAFGILLAQALAAFAEGVFNGSVFATVGDLAALPFKAAGRLYDSVGRKTEGRTWRGLCGLVGLVWIGSVILLRAIF